MIFQAFCTKNKTSGITKIMTFLVTVAVIMIGTSSFATATSSVTFPTVTLSSASEICGKTLSGTDKYLINSMSDIVCEGPGPTLTQGAILDCQGGTIRGPSTFNSQTGNNGVTLKGSSWAQNCFITEFDNGFVLDDTVGSRRLLNSQAIRNVVHGVAINGGGRNFLKKVTSQSNNYSGFSIADNMSGEVIIKYSTSDMNSQGMFIHRKVTGTVEMYDCDITNNNFHGVLVQSKKSVLIAKGTISGNKRHGVLATRTGAGIGVNDPALQIMEASITGNARMGVVATGLQKVEMTGCSIDGNSGNGVYVRGANIAMTCSEVINNAVNGVFGHARVASDIALKDSMIHGNTMDNIVDGATTVTMDNVQENSFDLSGKCGLYDKVVSPTVLVNADVLCNAMLTGSTKYVLMPNTEITCSGNGPTLSDSAILDCNGSTIKGSNSDNGITMNDSSSVNNCIVENFFNGLDVFSTSSGIRTVTNTELEGHANTVNVLGGGVIQLVDVSVIGSTLNGFNILGEKDDHIFVRLYAEGSNNPINILTAGPNTIFKDCVSFSNDSDGITLFDPLNHLDGGRSQDNTDTGLTMFDNVNTISDFIIDSNEDGIDYFGDTALLTIQGSIVDRNSDYGVWVTSSGVGLNIVCSQISNSGTEYGVRTSSGGAVTVTNSAVYDNGTFNFSDSSGSPPASFTGTNVYACGGGTTDIEFSVGSPLSTFICSDNTKCGMDCGSNSLEDFDLSANCAAYPLIK